MLWPPSVYVLSLSHILHTLLSIWRVCIGCEYVYLYFSFRWFFKPFMSSFRCRFKLIYWFYLQFIGVGFFFKPSVCVCVSVFVLSFFIVVVVSSCYIYRIYWMVKMWLARWYAFKRSHSQNSNRFLLILIQTRERPKKRNIKWLNGSFSSQFNHHKKNIMIEYCCYCCCKRRKREFYMFKSKR